MPPSIDLKSPLATSDCSHPGWTSHGALSALRLAATPLPRSFEVHHCARCVSRSSRGCTSRGRAGWHRVGCAAKLSIRRPSDTTNFDFNVTPQRYKRESPAAPLLRSSSLQVVLAISRLEKLVPRLGEDPKPLNAARSPNKPRLAREDPLRRAANDDPEQQEGRLESAVARIHLQTACGSPVDIVGDKLARHLELHVDLGALPLAGDDCAYEDGAPVGGKLVLEGLD